jgi:pimeloyl-ACP methyl ester carboxylesterase
MENRVQLFCHRPLCQEIPMPINETYRTWIQRISELRPKQRITQIRNFVWLLVGLYHSHSVNLSRIVGKVMSAAKNVSTVRRLSRFLANPANPIEPTPYQAQLAIGLSLLSEAAAFEDKLSRIPIPTLIVFGAHDKVVPFGNAGLLAEKIANSKVVIFPNAGHFFLIEIHQAASEAVIQLAG